MLVKFLGSLSKYENIEINKTNILEILNVLELTYGEELTVKLNTEKFFFIVNSKKEGINPVCLIPEVMLSSLEDYDTLVIAPDVEGELPAALVAAALEVSAATMATLSWTSVAVYALTAVINVGLMMAVNMLMNAIAPTHTFAGDPAYMQNRLFNGSLLPAEIGGGVPLIFGNPYCSGVVISSSMTSGDF